MERIDYLAEKNDCTKIEYARRYFEEQDCILVATEWPGVMKKMSYICKCGQKSEISWNNFTRGKRCGNCVKWGLKKKLSLEQVQEFFKKYNCEFLDNEYKGVHSTYNFKCACDNIDKLVFSAYYYKNIAPCCKQCALLKNCSENNHGWKKDREKHREEILFRKKCYKALSTTLQKTEQRKNRRTHELLGYTHLELKEHIEKHPNWQELKNGTWHLDHIFPIDAFLEHEIKDLKIINHLDNLQPLEGSKNISKSNKYDKEEFIQWLNNHNIKFVLDYQI